MIEKKKKRKRIFRYLYIFLVFAFIYIPMISVMVFSFNSSEMNIVFEHFTLRWYGSFFENRTLMEALWNSLYIAVAATVIATIIGTIGAVGMANYKFPLKGLVDKLLYIPIIIPEIVLGVALLTVYSFCNMPLGIWSIILAHVTFCIPFVVITVRARLAGFDKNLEEAAMDLGANRFWTFVKITLPIIMPGVISGAMLSFTLSLDDVIISFFCSGPGSTTLPLKILSMVKTGVTPEVNALSTVIMFVIILIISLNTGMQVKKLKRKVV